MRWTSRASHAGLPLPLLLLLIAGHAAAQSDVKVEARLTATRIGAGESTVLQVTVETQGAEPQTFDVPQLPPGLEVSGSQEFTQLQLSFPGGRTRVVRRDIIIRAHQPGQYMVPPVSVMVNGTPHRTSPILLTVEPRRRGTPALPSAGGGEVLLRAWLEPARAYVGQQVMLNAEAAFPRDLRQRQSRPASYDAPTPPHFWIQDLPEPITNGLRSVDGQVYETQTYRRAYFPLSAGTFDLPPARLVYEVRRGFLYAPESRELISDSLRLEVLPIPRVGQPESFTGAVGRFIIDARVEPETVRAGEAATLSVEIRGAGNVKALPPPKLPELEGVEVYPPSEESRTAPDEDELGGTKRFTWVLIPSASGRLQVPALEYGFFDPAAERFDVARTSPLALRVTAQPAPVAGIGSDTTLRRIALSPGGVRLGWVRSPAFAAIQVVPLLVLVAGFLVGRTGEAVRSRRTRRRLRGERQRAFESLRRAAISAESDDVFFGDFAAAIRGMVADLLERPELRTAGRDSLAAALREAELDEDTTTALDGLFQRVDHARFARLPASPAERSTLVADARRVMQRVDAGLRPIRTTPRMAAAALILALLPATAVSLNSGRFAQGVAAYQDQRWEEAVGAFTDHVRASADDPAGWYNLGNAYARADRRGHAVWSWLHALELDPRHGDARHNIAAVGAGNALSAAPTRLSLTLEEALLVVAALWWMAALAGALLLARRRTRRIPIVAGVAGVLFAVTAAAASLPRALRAPVAVAIEERSALLSAPTLHSDAVANIEEGTPLHLLERRGAWWRVREPGRREGWIEAALLAESF